MDVTLWKETMTVVKFILSSLFLLLLVFSSVVAEAPKPRDFIATAYCLSGRTASGQMVHKGVLSADLSVLPMGTTVHIDAGSYSGTYTVKDTGGAIKNRRLDLWLPSHKEAMQFGRRLVKLTVLQYGKKVGNIVRPRKVNG